MHFDPRTQRALAEAGLDREAIERASEAVVEAVREDAAALEAFFDARDAVHSDMSLAHSDADLQEHAVEYLDLYTHGADLRGYLRFESWGAYVEGGRPLGEGTVELTLGPTVYERVRFAADPADL